MAKLEVSEVRKWRNRYNNFLTPDLISLKRINKNLFAEISKGYGMVSKMLYGVTLIGRKKGKLTTTLYNSRYNKVFRNKKLAISYVEKLKKRLGTRRS